MKERTAYQENIIKRYYENRDTIMVQKLSELVTELYLAEGKKRTQLWKRAATALKNLGIADSIIAHLIEQDKPELLLRYVENK